jgi:hypothetical protein
MHAPEPEPQKALRDKILFTLAHYPVLTPTMLQVGIGPHHAPKDWRPILQQLLDTGFIRREEETTTSTYGQARTLVKLRLTPSGVTAADEVLRNATATPAAA